MSRIVFLCFYLLTVFSASSSSPPLRVGALDNRAPFSYASPHGEMQGASLKLWSEIADENNWSYHLQNIGSDIEKAIESLANNKVDVLVGPFTMNQVKKHGVIYTAPFFLGEIGVLVPEQNHSIWSTLKLSFGGDFSNLFFLLLGAFFLGVFVTWLMERKEVHALSKPKEGLSRIGWAFFLTLTSVAVNYTPHTFYGRFIKMLWITLSIIFLTVFSGTISSIITTTTLQSDYSSSAHLSGKTLVYIEGHFNRSFLENIVKKYDVTLLKANNIQEAFDLLDDKKASAIMGETTFLEHALHENPLRKGHVSHLILAKVLFSFVVRQEKDFEEKIELTFKSLKKSGKIHRIIIEALNINDLKKALL